MIKLRIVFLILLTFTINPFLKAEDITDFQIEGMSVGDSLLEYMTPIEIKNNERDYFSGKKRYYVVGFFNSKTYDAVDIYLKTNDENYIIRTLGGQIDIKGNACVSKKIQSLKRLANFFQI